MPQETRILMGMPVTVRIEHLAGNTASGLIEKAFAYLDYVDRKFSTYKSDSEISCINRKEILKRDWSWDMKEVFSIAEKTRRQTRGYFDMVANDGLYDPSGVVKGWGIKNAARLLKEGGAAHFYVEAGGDIQVSGSNDKMQPWRVGIRNPFNKTQSVKTLQLGCGEGIATSGSYERGSHVYNPLNRTDHLEKIVSVTVIASDVLEADRFATAAFAMGSAGIGFIESLRGFEGYMIDAKGVGTATSGFSKYEVH